MEFTARLHGGIQCHLWLHPTPDERQIVEHTRAVATARIGAAAVAQATAAGAEVPHAGIPAMLAV